MKRTTARFLRGLEQSASEHTLRAYRQNLQTLIAFCADEGVTKPRQITHRLLRGFLVSLNARGLQKSSMARYLAAARAYTRFLVREGIVAKDPAANLRTPTHRRPLPLHLGEDEVSRLIEAAPTARDVPGGLDHRGAEGAGDGDHRRARGVAPRALHGLDRDSDR